VDLDRGLGPAVEDLGVKPARGASGHAAAEDDRGLIGAPQGELIGNGCLEPRSARARPVKRAGVGDLQLPEREVIVVAAAVVLVGERGRERGLPAIKERADI
jgi:hypothetical protein